MKQKYTEITKANFKTLIYKHSTSINTFAVEFGVSRASIYTWLSSGKVPTHVYDRLLIANKRIYKTKTLMLPVGLVSLRDLK